MKNTSHNSTVAKAQLRRRSKEIAIESSFGAWSLKNGCSEEKALGYLEQLAIMIQLDENMTNLVKWKLKYGITKSCLHYWRKKYPKFSEQYDDLKDFIAERLEDNSFWKKGDFQTFRLVVPRYSSEHKDLEEWRARLKEDEKKTPPVIIVKAAEIPSVIEPAKPKETE